MAYFDAEQVAVDYMAAQGLGVVGETIFKGPALEPQKDAVPRDAIYAMIHDGGLPVRYMGTLRKSFKRCTVEILIRSSPEKREQGRNLSLAVLNSFDKDSTLNVLGCMLLESAPRYLERDRLQNHLWLVKIELWDVS